MKNKNNDWNGLKDSNPPKRSTKPHAQINPIVSANKGADISPIDLETKLGKIESVSFGVEDGRLGLHFTFTFGSTGCVWYETIWDFATVERTEYSKWTEMEHEQEAVELMKKISNYLSDAKVSNIQDLKNRPIEATFEGRMLKSWRILTEVL